MEPYRSVEEQFKRDIVNTRLHDLEKGSEWTKTVVVIGAVASLILVIVSGVSGYYAGHQQKSMPCHSTMKVLPAAAAATAECVHPDQRMHITTQDASLRVSCTCHGE